MGSVMSVSVKKHQTSGQILHTGPSPCDPFDICSFRHRRGRPAVERRTRSLCSTSGRAKRTSAPSCPTAPAVRPTRTLCPDSDGRCGQNTKKTCKENEVLSLEPYGQILTPHPPPRPHFRWTWPRIAASWAASRRTAARASPPPTTLPPPWKPSSTSPPGCRRIRTTA